MELHYTELLLPTDGRYRFVYPTVVGPRYQRAEADGRADAVAGDAAPAAKASARLPRSSMHGALRLAAAGARPGLAVAPHRGPGRSQRAGRGRARRRRRGRRRPRLHPRVPAGGRGHRGRADAVQGPAGRGELLPRPDRAAARRSPTRRSTRASTSSSSTSRARCTAFRSTRPRRCCAS